MAKAAQKAQVPQEPDFDKVGDRVAEMYAEISHHRWALGDYLIAEGIISSKYIRMVAERANISVKTLETYRDTSAEFPEERRDYELAWGVFKQLQKLSEFPDAAAWQDKFLIDHPRATTSVAEHLVTAEIKRRRGTKTKTIKTRDTAISGNLVVDVEDREGRGVGIVEISGFTDDPTLRFNEMTQVWEVQGLTA